MMLMYARRPKPAGLLDALEDRIYLWGGGVLPFSAWDGPVMRVRNRTNSAEQDFYATRKYRGLSFADSREIAAWLNGAPGEIVRTGNPDGFRWEAPAVDTGPSPILDGPFPILGFDAGTPNRLVAQGTGVNQWINSVDSCSVLAIGQQDNFNTQRTWFAARTSGSAPRVMMSSDAGGFFSAARRLNDGTLHETTRITQSTEFVLRMLHVDWIGRTIVDRVNGETSVKSDTFDESGQSSATASNAIRWGIGAASGTPSPFAGRHTLRVLFAPPKLNEAEEAYVIQQCQRLRGIRFTGPWAAA